MSALNMNCGSFMSTPFPLCSNEKLVEILGEDWALIEVIDREMMVIGHVCSKSSEVRLMQNVFQCDQCHEFLPDSIKFLALSLDLS
jgi:hypothetical protein